MIFLVVDLSTQFYSNIYKVVVGTPDIDHISATYETFEWKLCDIIRHIVRKGHHVPLLRSPV
jgi:hypothetical protein